VDPGADRAVYWAAATWYIGSERRSLRCVDPWRGRWRPRQCSLTPPSRHAGPVPGGTPP